MPQRVDLPMVECPVCFTRLELKADNSIPWHKPMTHSGLGAKCRVSEFDFQRAQCLVKEEEALDETGSSVIDENEATLSQA